MTLPPHCTAIGKALLAFDPEEQLRSTLPEQLTRYTERTIVDRAQLLEQLQSVIREGYAVDAGEFFEDVASVAVPIRDYTRSVVGSLAVAGPCYRICTERITIVLAPPVLEPGRELPHPLPHNTYPAPSPL